MKIIWSKSVCELYPGTLAIPASYLIVLEAQYLYVNRLCHVMCLFLAYGFGWNSYNLCALLWLGYVAGNADS